MAKGTRGGKRAGGLRDSAGNLVGNADYSMSALTQQGETANFSTPLVYGTDTGRNPTSPALAKFYDRIDKQKIEYEIAIDNDGNVIKEQKGGKTSVQMSMKLSQWEKNVTDAHLHPRNGGAYEAETIGGTFSVQDIVSFTTFKYAPNLKTYQAVAKEGVYSLSKGKNFDGKGLLNLRKSLEHQYFGANSTYETKKKELKAKYGIHSKEYLSGKQQLFNEALIGIHDGLRAHQNTYGYTYALEKRK